MKICHITSVHNYDDIRISIKECSSLVKANYEVYLIAPNTESKNYMGIRICGVNNPYKGRIKRVINYTKDIYLKALEIDADIYHFHDPELIPTGLKLRKKGKKVIYDIHEDLPRQILTKYWIPKSLRKTISFIIEKYENRSVKKFDALVTATPYIKKRFIKYSNKVININNYPIMSELYEGNLKKKKKNNLIYVGALSEGRGSVRMIDAISKTEANLILAGAFSNQKEKEKLEELSGWSKVNFLGYVGRNEINDILGASIGGFVVLEPKANFLDSLPIKMFEYMAVGLPVIASDFPLWKEIIEKGKCGICVDPLNTNEVAEAIQWIIDNPEEAEEMGRNGRKAVEEKYNWESESIKLLNLYEDLT